MRASGCLYESMMRLLPCWTVLALFSAAAMGLSIQNELELEAASLAVPDKGMSTAEEQESSAEQRTLMQCLGTQTMTRACHFENVYYDLSTSRFVHFGVAGATAALFGEDHSPDEPWLRLVRGMSEWRQGSPEAATQFYLDWRPGEALPAAEEVVGYETPLHLRAPFNTKSIGHLLRDSLQFLIDLPIRFGRDPAVFDWVRWHSNMSFADWETESTTAEHYRGLFNNRPSVTWQQVLDQALSSSSTPGVRYIRFAELIAGQGPADFFSQVGSLWGEITTERLAAWAHMCDPFPFTAMRHVAYRNFGMQVASVHELEPFVLFLDGQPDEKRHLANADDLIPKLKETFPGVRMEHVEISAYPLEEQLQFVSKATVVVSNIGSRSFRLIYLPNGATTILVGPPEFEFMLEPLPEGTTLSPGTRYAVVQEPTPFTLRIPFIEIDWCWGYIGYVNMLRYHVATEAEVHRNKRHWHSAQDARNTDVMLDEGKLTDLLRVALRRAEHSTAQRGSGDLSAFDS